MREPDKPKTPEEIRAIVDGLADSLIDCEYHCYSVSEQCSRDSVADRMSDVTELMLEIVGRNGGRDD